MRATPPRRDRTRWRIGSLDSNPRSRAAVRRLIESAVATVVVDSPPRPESVALLRSLEPDAVLLSAEDAIRSGDAIGGVLPPDLPAPLVLVSGPATAGALTPGRIAGVMGVLLRPLRAEELRPTVEIAIARFRELRRLRRVLADRPVVEAAKAWLMARDGLSEAAAFGWLRRRAMEQRMCMGEVARTVLKCEGRTPWHAGKLNVVGLLVKRGATQWGDEPVSGLDHALQCAALARAARAPEELVLAALLHDVGHLLSASEETPFTHHGLWAARFLRPFVSPRVVWLVEHHVLAKRYLCTVDRAYAESLSLGSLRSWIRQGGALDRETRQEMERQPWLSEVLAIRRWDEASKEPGAIVPTLSAYRDLLEACFGRQPWEAAGQDLAAR